MDGADGFVDELLESSSVHCVAFDAKELAIKFACLVEPALVPASLSFGNGKAEELLLAVGKSFWDDEVVKGFDLDSFGL